MKRKKNNYNRQIIIIFLFTILLLPALQVEADECLVSWSNVVKFPNSGGAYPEWSATYWAHMFDNSDHNRAIVIEGKFPYARYMSYVLYDATTGDLLGSLLDKDIETDDENQNPYIPGNPRNTDRSIRNYTIKIVQEGSFHAGGPNVLTIPENVETVVLLMRIYLSDQPYLQLENRGGVALPTISYHLDNESLDDAGCPNLEEYLQLVQDINDILDSEDPPNPVAEEKLLEDRIVFYRHHPIDEEGVYANGNNNYLTAPLINMPNQEENDNQLALVRFRAPTFPPTYYGEVEYFTGEEDVRYWSVCLVNIADGSTSRCIHDEEALLDADGWVNLAIGPYEFFQEKPVAGWNYMPWGSHKRPAVMIRQIIPREDFSGDYAEAEETYLAHDPLDPASDDNYVYGMTVEEFRTYSLELVDTNDGILGDYHPKGIYCSEQAFEDGLCVIQ